MNCAKDTKLLSVEWVSNNEAEIEIGFLNEKGHNIMARGTVRLIE